MATKFKKPLRKIVDFSPKEWRRLGDVAAITQKREIRDKKFFKNVSYTNKYRKRKVAGKAGVKGVSVSSRSSVPDLTLSGKFLNSIRSKKANKFGVTVGPGREFEKIALGNAANKRDITDDRLVEIMTKAILDRAEQLINKKINRSKETIRIKANL